MAIIAIIAALGLAAVPFGGVPQANAAGQGTIGNFGLCNSLANAYGSAVYDLSGKDLADARKAYCS